MVRLGLRAINILLDIMDKNQMGKYMMECLQGGDRKFDNNWMKKNNLDEILYSSTKDISLETVERTLNILMM